MQSSHGEQAANELQAVREEIRQLKAKVKAVEDKAEADPALKLALLQQLPGLRQELGALRQKEERLAAAEAAAAAAARSGRFDAEQPVDNSEALCSALLHPHLDRPPALNDLRTFFEQAPAAQVPVNREALDALHSSPLKARFCVAYGQLAVKLGSCISPVEHHGSSEHFTLIKEAICFMEPLLCLDKYAGTSAIGLQLTRNQGDTASLVTKLSHMGQPLRPDGIILGSHQRMLAKFEDKPPGDLEGAIDDLASKTCKWTPLYYGDIQYLPCFAASGDLLQLFAINKDNVTRPIPVSRVFNLTVTDDRARLVMAVVQFYRLLKAQLALYPLHVLRAGQTLTETTAGLAERLLYFRTDTLTVRKIITPWSSYRQATGVTLEGLRRLYEKVKDCQGVIHCVEPPVLEKAGKPVADTYAVDLYPVGLQYHDAKPETEEQLRAAAHGLLHGLEAIHKAGFVHRDPRWPNTACSLDRKRRYWLDLEASAPADQLSGGFRATCWDEHTLVQGKFTIASDLYLLGRMLQEHVPNVASHQCLRFMEDISVRPSFQPKTAKDLLQYEWLQCQGDMCIGAGAQPQELQV